MMQTQTQTKQKMKCKFNSHAKLTVGREYTILKEEDNKVFVVDDSGKEKSFYKSRFE